jgi:hypothetical protein
MSIDLVIANIPGSVRSAAAAPPAATSISVGTTSTKATSGTSSAAATQIPSPAQLTPGFSVVVLQLRNSEGDVTSTIPSAKQLAAYGTGLATPPT